MNSQKRHVNHQFATPSPSKKSKFHRNGGNSAPGDSKNGNNHLRDERQHLPIFSARGRLIQKLMVLDTAIVIGETGSGKTTQIPQYLYEAGVNRKLTIACTQPRRVAAITVAQRVAKEMGCELGKEVGYCVRFDDTSSHETKIRYMTDGMLLREAILDPKLKRYSVIILDEAHERTVHTDVLFGVVKKAQMDRKAHGAMPLKIVVMSATMDVDHFSHYFNKSPVLYIEGRQYPVKLMYTKESQSDYMFSALVTIFQIHQEAPPNEDILVFLTGQEEIDATVQSIRDISQDMTSDCPGLVAYPLYSALPAGQQLKVFQPAPQGHRKVIVSTNIAETSVTIHGIKHVIDSGVVKAKLFNAASGLDLLKVQRISQGQAWQRTGRAGRESPGVCYRLYTEVDFHKLRANTIPEIQRCNLASVALQLMALGVKDLASFDFMDKPTAEGLEKAIESLQLLGAVSRDNNTLTDLGRQMAAFPLEPRFAKVLLAASDQKCLEEVLTIVSVLSVDSVIHTPHSKVKRETAQAARRKFISTEGDHITFLNIYRGFKGVNGNKQWCMENFVNGRNLKTAQDIRRQLRDICVRQQLKLQSCGRDHASIRRCMCSGFFMNAAELTIEGVFTTVNSRKPVAIHPSSSLFQCKPGYIIYTELVKTTKSYMRNVCMVDPDWLFDAAPAYFKRKLVSK